jgi:hypothetical protein
MRLGLPPPTMIAPEKGERFQVREAARSAIPKVYLAA